jgi:phosphoglycolate phosphatase-like HAD superfamily hydrolase
LPLGSAADGPDTQTVHGLGNRKDRYFSEQIEQHGVEVYAPAIELVRALRELEIKTAVVSSSKNCAAVLRAAGIAQLFDTHVDGNDVVRMNLMGKPAPDAFLEAARRRVRLRLTRDTLTVRERERGGAPIQLGFRDEVYEFAGGTRVLKLESGAS